MALSPKATASHQNSGDEAILHPWHVSALLSSYSGDKTRHVEGKRSVAVKTPINEEFVAIHTLRLLIFNTQKIFIVVFVVVK